MLEAEAQRKVPEAVLLQAVRATTVQAGKAGRERLAMEAENYIQRSKQKARKTVCLDPFKTEKQRMGSTSEPRQ